MKRVSVGGKMPFETASPITTSSEETAKFELHVTYILLTEQRLCVVQRSKPGAS